MFTVLFAASGQNRYSSVRYSLAFPTGNTQDYISKTSFRGVEFEFGSYINTHWSIGLQMGYQTFYKEMGKTSYPIRDGVITGYQYRYIHAVPLLLQPRYHFAANAKINPFVGMGVGTYWVEQTTEMGLYAWVDKIWHFGLAPEAGIGVGLGMRSMLFASAQYNWALPTAHFDSRQWMSMKLGFTYAF